MGLTTRIVSGALLALLIAWLIRWMFMSSPMLEAPSDLDTSLDYVLRDFSGEFYDTNGNLSLRIHGPRLQHDPDTGIATVTAPSFLVEPGGGLWEGGAALAAIDRGTHTVSLEGAVTLRQPEAPGGEILIETERLVYDQKAKTISGEHPVRLTQPGAELNARGVILSLETEILRLQHNVEGYWTPPGN